MSTRKPKSVAARSELRDLQVALTRERILEAVLALLTAGHEPTFALVAARAGCQERTVYRHFASREALAAAFWRWHFGASAPIERNAASEAELLEWVGAAFQRFDEEALLVRAMLHTEHGRAARLADNEARRAMMLRCVQRALSGVDAPTRRRVAAATQLLCSAAAWEVLRDYWQLDGKAAARVAQLAIRALLAGVRAGVREPLERNVTRKQKGR